MERVREVKRDRPGEPWISRPIRVLEKTHIMTRPDNNRTISVFKPPKVNEFCKKFYQPHTVNTGHLTSFIEGIEDLISSILTPNTRNITRTSNICIAY